TSLGLFLYDAERKILRQLKAQDIKMSDAMFVGLLSVFTDRSGVTWVGTPGYGLIRYSPSIERFNHVMGRGISTSIQGIWEDNDLERIWFAKTDAIISYYDRKNMTIVEPGVKRNDDGYKYSKIASTSFCVDEHGYWIINDFYIWYFDHELNVRKKITDEK